MWLTYLENPDAQSKESTPLKSLYIESSELTYRREKPSNLITAKGASIVPTRTVALSCAMEHENRKKTPLSTTGRKNAQQIARALKRLSDLE